MASGQLGSQLVVPTLQRLLSDLLYLFFHDSEDPHQLWAWWKIIWMLAAVVELFWMVAI